MAARTKGRLPIVITDHDQFTHPYQGAGSTGTHMSYVVEFRRESQSLSMVMSAIREWLDAQRFEPNSFRCTTDEEAITCHLAFKFESEARACDAAFGGQSSSLGDQSTG